MSAQLDNILTAVGERSSSFSQILDDTEQFLSRFVAYPSEQARIAHVLWIAHTHCMDEWDSTPRIVFASPEPGSGKTRALEITETLVTRPIESVNATPAYLFRKVSDEDGLPTILYDEIDTVFGPKAKDNEEVRGFLNAGHRRGAMAGRCVTSGKTVRTEELPAYCAVAMAGLGNNLPDTILTRSVVVQMRRRAPKERIEPYRRRIHSGDGNALRDRFVAWAENFCLDGNYPDMPDGVEDRSADVWEPLLAVAEAASERWSKRAREAAQLFVKASVDTKSSLGVKLLEDIRKVFKNEDHLATKILIQRLCALDESPWGDLRGKELDPRRLANLLKPYGIKSATIRIGESTPRGYTRESLFDTWTRYLNPPKAATSATAQQSIAGAGFSVSDKPSVADKATTRGNGKNAEPSDISQGNDDLCGGKQVQQDTQAQHSNPDVAGVVANVLHVADLQGVSKNHPDKTNEVIF